MNQNNKRSLYIYLAVLMLVVFLVIFLVMSRFNSATTKKEAEYDLIIADFLENRVGEYQLDFNTRTLTYTLWEGMPDPEKEGETGQSGEADEATQPPAGGLIFSGARVPDSSLFVKAVHEHCLEYNEEHPDRPIKIVYIGYSDPSFLTTWLPVLLLVVIAMVALCMWAFWTQHLRGKVTDKASN